MVTNDLPPGRHSRANKGKRVGGNDNGVSDLEGGCAAFSLAGRDTETSCDLGELLLALSDPGSLPPSLSSSWAHNPLPPSCHDDVARTNVVERTCDGGFRGRCDSNAANRSCRLSRGRASPDNLHISLRICSHPAPYIQYLSLTWPHRHTSPT
jgi:hypothetical protein